MCLPDQQQDYGILVKLTDGLANFIVRLRKGAIQLDLVPSSVFVLFECTSAIRHMSLDRFCCKRVNRRTDVNWVAIINNSSHTSISSDSFRATGQVVLGIAAPSQQLGQGVKCALEFLKKLL
ncbi:hypothetical protein D3C77_218570 [compost metagenome]